MEIQLGVFILDLSFLEAFLAQSPFAIVFQIFSLGFWLIFFHFAIKYGLKLYVGYRQGKFKAPWKHVVLAVDIPLLNVQTPKAVEQLFAHLAGALSQPGLGEKYRGGFVQRGFSFEVISIEGYIQFIIRTEEKFRDLVEAALYAQYPEAEIVEIEDYVNFIPHTYPNDSHDLWAAEFVLAEDNAYPIRTYREFEHSISKDTVLKDPMGAFLESFSRISIGEQMWFQIVVEPISNKWKEDAIKKIKELIGEKVKAKRTAGQKAADKFSDASLTVVRGIGDQLFNRESTSAEKKDDGPQNKLQYLTPGQSRLIEAMEDKISKLGFKSKMRGMYLARKEIFRPERGVHSMIGAINQFNIPTANSITPAFTSGASDKKKSLIMKGYVGRSLGGGKKPFILNIEELATVWHFPMSHVKTPLLQKKTTKSAEPPAALPIERAFGAPPRVEPVAPPTAPTPGYVTDSGLGFEDDEVQFG